MELKKGQIVVFENGHEADVMEARWSETHKAFYYASDETDEEGKRKIFFSDVVINKESRKNRKFVPSEKNCKKQIYPISETEKAYVIEDGTDGHIKHTKEYFKYIAKSICFVDEEGRIFAPVWA